MIRRSDATTSGTAGETPPYSQGNGKAMNDTGKARNSGSLHHERSWAVRAVPSD